VPGDVAQLSPDAGQLQWRASSLRGVKGNSYWFVFVNRTAPEFPEEQLLGSPIEDVLREEDRASTHERIESVFRSGEHTSFEVVVPVAEEDKRKFLLVHVRPNVRWHDGMPVTAHDVEFTIALKEDPEVLLGMPGRFAVDVLDDTTLTFTGQERRRRTI
jgi:Bacterial extracellular solute-binding proteins, family 5 Middle